MRDFDTVLDRAGTTRVTVVSTTPVVAERVVVTHQPVAAATHALKVESEWGWEELRDYVVEAITKRHGPFPRNMKTEHSIFKSFAQRYGADAPAIARFAFEFCDGMWKNAPIGVNRFCKGSDPYFGDPIRQRIHS